MTIETLNRWKRENPDKVKAYPKKHPEKIKRIKARSREKNREKRNMTERRQRKENPELSRRRWLRRKHKLTLEEYNRMFERQNGCCAICGKPEIGRVFHVDHNHKTGKIRDLLCNGCNFRLGVVENEGFVIKALAYLKKHKQVE